MARKTATPLLASLALLAGTSLALAANDGPANGTGSGNSAMPNGAAASSDSAPQATPGMSQPRAARPRNQMLSPTAQNGEVDRLNQQSLQAAQAGRPFSVGGDGMDSGGGMAGSGMGMSPSSNAGGAMQGGPASPGAPSGAGTQAGSSSGMH